MSQGFAKQPNQAKETGGNLARLLDLHQTKITNALNENLVELRLQTILLAQAFGIKDNLEALRDEIRRTI